MKSFLNLITNIRRAGNSAKLDSALSAFEAERLKQIEQALAVRPFFLPVLFNKTGVVNNDVIPGTTDSNIREGLEVLGGITDITNRDCQIRDLGSKIFWADKHVNIETFFGFGGNNANTTGRMGMYLYDVPFPLQAGNSIEVQLKNTTGGSAAIQGYTVFLCQRVLRDTHPEANLTELQRENLIALIKSSRAPRPARLRANVEFSAASATGTATAITDKAKTHTVITGAYANSLYRSTVDIKLPDGTPLSNTPIPSWAVFQRQGIITSQVNNFRPFFVPKDGLISMKFYNGDVAAGAFDPVQNLGTGVIPNVTFFGYEIA